MSAPWRLVYVNRHEGHIFSHKAISTPQEIPAVCFPWSGIRIPGSTIRLVSQPPSVCKIYRNSLTPLTLLSGSRGTNGRGSSQTSSNNERVFVRLGGGHSRGQESEWKMGSTSDQSSQTIWKC